MKELMRLGLMVAVVLVLASCVENAGRSGGDQGNGTKSMDHGKSGGMAGMDHGKMGSGGMSNMSGKMVMPDGKYSDAAFVDAMIPHHEGAVEMAEVAVKNAGHKQVERLAHNIISSQQAEIKELEGIREGLDGPVKRMSGQNISMMGMMENPQRLADADPFDKAFIDHMIPHHESAIAMARVALQQSNNPQIKDIAGDIVSAQKREIEEMKQWRQEWYPEG